MMMQCCLQHNSVLILYLQFLLMQESRILYMLGKALADTKLTILPFFLFSDLKTGIYMNNV